MANMKRLAEYMTRRCELWSDLNREEFIELNAEHNADGRNVDNQFVKHEIRDGKLYYTYACEYCECEHEHEIEIETDYLYIGSAPSEEDCIWPSIVGCRALILQLKNIYGNEPEGARLAAKYEPGEDGYEVVCYYDTRFPMSMGYAYMLEGNLPEKWSQAAKDYIAKAKGGN